MSKSLKKVDASGQATASSLLLLDKAAVASGSSSLAYTRVLVELSLAMSGLKTISIATSTSLKGVTASLIGLTGLGILATLAAAGAILGVVFARKPIADWIEGVKGANEELDKQKKALQEVRDKQKQVNDQIRIQIAQAKGNQFAGIRNTGQLRLAKELVKVREIEARKAEGLRRREARGIALTGIQKVTDDRIASLQTELDIMSGRIKITDLIINQEERELTIKKNQLEIEKKRVQEEKLRADASRDAFRSRRAELGLTGRRSLLNELRGSATSQLGSQFRRAMQIKLIDALPLGLQETARKMLGVSTAAGISAAGGDAASLGGVRQALSAGGVAFGGVSQEKDISKASLGELRKIEKILQSLLDQEKGLGNFEEN